MGGESKASGPDFGEVGLAASELREGAAVVGQVGGEGVVLTRCGGEVFATGATCTHYGGPLGEGLVKDGTIRCPWHHARFDLKSGEALGPPGLGAIPCYQVEQRGDRLFVLGRKSAHSGPGGNPVHQAKTAPSSVVIVGAGPAGAVTAEALRRQGFEGAITVLSADGDDPVDRPNLSKDYLAGNAPEEWIPLRGPAFGA
jgi:nitrite reductase/ring-hydroxylating ferredoxin subunit